MNQVNRRRFLKAAAMAAASCSLIRGANAKTRQAKPVRLFDGRTLKGWLQIENGATTLSPSQITDQASLMNKLANGADAVSVFLRSQLDTSAVASLASYSTSAPDAKAAVSVVVKTLNRVIGGPSMYSKGRFENSIALRPETRRLLGENPSGQQLARLNKLLVEDAYPTEIAQSMSTGWEIHDGAMASLGAGRGVIYTAQDYSRYRLLYNVRHVTGHPDHQAGVLFFCKRPQQDEVPLDALGGIQFQVPMGSHWDYRPANNNSGDPFFTTIAKSPFDRHAWSQVELLVDAGKGAARMAVAQPPGSKAIELVTFSDPSAGRTGPIAFQMHNAGLFDEYKDVTIEVNPQYDGLITIN
jgi:hypothetical protein